MATEQEEVKVRNAWFWTPISFYVEFLGFGCALCSKPTRAQFPSMHPTSALTMRGSTSPISRCGASLIRQPVFWCLMHSPSWLSRSTLVCTNLTKISLGSVSPLAMRTTGRSSPLPCFWIVQFGLKTRISSVVASQLGLRTELSSTCAGTRLRFAALATVKKSTLVTDLIYRSLLFRHQRSRSGRFASLSMRRTTIQPWRCPGLRTAETIPFALRGSCWRCPSRYRRGNELLRPISGRYQFART
jgi:hypothetical protein